MTYAGFFVNLSKIPPVLRWLRWFDVLGYALEATVVNEVGAGLEIVDSLAGGKSGGDNRFANSSSSDFTVQILLSQCPSEFLRP